MLWAAVTSCFFGFFIAGELTVPTLSSYNATAHLSWGDVTIDDPTNPTRVCIYLKRSKCDQLGNGVRVYLGRTGDELCPTATTLAYVAARGNDSGPFFRFQDKSPLTKARFVAKVRDALKLAGVEYKNYSGNSFRRGAAATAAKAGIADSTIQALGRWNSAAFLAYIKISRDQLADFSRPLARQC